MFMIWLIVIGCVVAVAFAVGLLVWTKHRPRPDAGMYQGIVGLYAIRRRFDVFQFKVETRQAEAQVRRRLSKVHDLRQREREL